MKKSDLHAMVAAKFDIPKPTAALAVDCLFEAMADALVRGNKIEIRGLGSWVAKRYGAKTGRNPKTGKSIKVPAKRLPYFKAGKDLADRIMVARNAHGNID